MREVAHLEQLGTWGDPGRNPRRVGDRDRLPRARPARRRSLRARPTRAGTRSTTSRRPPSTTARSSTRARERLRGKLSYSNIGFALAPDTFTLTELRDVYAAALGYDVSATNLKRVLLRRGAIVPTGGRRDPGRAGGRPAEEFAFSEQALEITDPFAALRPPESRHVTPATG